MCSLDLNTNEEIMSLNFRNLHDCLRYSMFSTFLDFSQAERLKKETKSDICGWTRSRHGWVDKGMVPSADKKNL